MAWKAIEKRSIHTGHTETEFGLIRKMMHAAATGAPFYPTLEERGEAAKIWVQFDRIARLRGLRADTTKQVGPNGPNRDPP